MSDQTTFQPGQRAAIKVSARLQCILSLIGFTSVIAQIVLMRELIVVFYGNEISLGIMLAGWLLWTAIGSSVSGQVSARLRDSRKLMACLQTLIAAVFPLTILAVRASRPVLQSVPGEILGPAPMFLTSFVTLSVFCLLSGALFAAGSRLCADEARTSTASAASSVYLLEAAGSGLGGVLASLVLIRYCTSFEIALFVALLNLLAAAWVGSPRAFLPPCPAGADSNCCASDSARRPLARGEVARAAVAWFQSRRVPEFRLWQSGVGGDERKPQPFRKRAEGFDRA